MNAMENQIYQRLVQSLRVKTNNGTRAGWPGKPRYATAVTRYPNIAAEICAETGFPWIDYPAQFANVSREIIAAVIEDGEELTFGEFVRLAERWDRGPVEYLSSPILQLIDPRTNKGKVRRRILSELLDKTACISDKDGVVIGLARINARFALKNMDDGRVITYAAWSGACRDLEHELDRYDRMKKRAIRTRRTSKREGDAV